MVSKLNEPLQQFIFLLGNLGKLKDLLLDNSNEIYFQYPLTPFNGHKDFFLENTELANLKEY